MNLELHHIGICVESIQKSVENYKKLFGESCCSQIYSIQSQEVNVCFINTGGEVLLELVEPTSENSVVQGLLKKGISYYHLAYKVTDIEKAVNELEILNYIKLSNFNSEAFNNKRCIFLFGPESHLIELIEK